MILIATVLLVAGFSVDMLNFCLGARRLRGNGPSGVPVVGLGLFWSGVAILHFSNHIAQPDALSFGKWYLLAHLLANYGLLYLADAVLRLRGK
jgi:hypothetical protein